MRERLADQLGEIEQRLEHELDGIGGALGSIADSIVDPADDRAAHLCGAARRLRAASRQADEQLVAVTAQQAPAASDLRLVLCLIQLAHHALLIANQFELCAEQLRQLDPDADDPQQTGQQLSLMTELAGQQMQCAIHAFATRDLAAATALQRHDDALDRINRQVFAATYELEADARGRELAFRYVLIARSLERIGDNAVDIAEQAAFLVTAELREFTDASRPKPR